VPKESVESSPSAENYRTKRTEKHAPATSTTEISSVVTAGDALYTPVPQHLWPALHWHAIC
jgi:hypothetical protein